MLFIDLYINQVSCRVSWSLLHAKVNYRLQIQLLFQCYRRFMQHSSDIHSQSQLVSINKATETFRSCVVTIQWQMHFTSRSHKVWPDIRLSDNQKSYSLTVNFVRTNKAQELSVLVSWQFRDIFTLRWGQMRHDSISDCQPPLKTKTQTDWLSLKETSNQTSDVFFFLAIE